jgi:hypothetical protein
MNERIKLLMGQVLDEKFAGTWSTMDLQDLTQFADRFAELIVRECARVASDYDGAHYVGTLIEDHFGVKE